jgi:hypothetical protein
MAHRSARLTVFGRRLLVDRVEADGWTVARAAEAAGVSRQSATTWVRRYRALGSVGLVDRSSRPHRSPRRPPPDLERAVLVARHELGYGPHRLAPVVGVPRSTIGDVLARHGCRASPTATGRRASQSALSASAPASCSTPRSWGASPTVAATASAAEAPGRPVRIADATASTWRSTR